MKIRTRIIGAVVGTFALVAVGTTAYAASDFRSLTPGTGNYVVQHFTVCKAQLVSNAYNAPNAAETSQDVYTQCSAVKVQVRYFVPSAGAYGLTAQVSSTYDAVRNLSSGDELLTSYHWATS
jgi:hypothetical protein